MYIDENVPNGDFWHHLVCHLPELLYLDDVTLDSLFVAVQSKTRLILVERVAYACMNECDFLCVCILV